MNPLAIVTICKDNLHELEATLASVFYQSSRPTRHLIVDGSSDERRNEVRKLCERFGADYHWRRPEGIYDAMRQSLALLDDEEFVWFLNATDWLSSNDSVKIVVDSMASDTDETKTKWWVGKTMVAGEIPHLMKFASTGAEFAKKLNTGSLGLPHSSTIVQVGALRRAEAFEGPYRISQDYEMGLRLFNLFGSPKIISFPLSVYDETGESAKNAWLNVLHKSEARIKNQPWWQLPAEPIRILAAGRRELLRRRLRKNPDNERLWRALGWERTDPKLVEPYWFS